VKFVTEIYCQDPDCNVRHSTVVTKKVDDAPEPRAWKCPGCGKRAKVHWRKTGAAYAAEKLKGSIGAVNAALYQRDHGGLGVPLALMCLSELPAEWKAVDR
jgi:hypothetical protein